MSRRISWSGALALAGLFVAPLAAQEPTRAQVARQAKAATAFVQVDGTFKQGSAFCLHETGFFLTNQHVVGTAAGVQLVLNPGSDAQRIVPARVVRADRDVDLALLKVEAKSPFTALALGSSDGLTELTEVIAVGFPFGKALSVEKGAYPEVSVNLGRVTSLRMKKGRLERIQMDAAVNPGNSGGPVLDLGGKVIGVVVSGVRGTTVNFAIPARHVQGFVASPEVTVLPLTVAYQDRYKPVEFRVRTTTLVPSKDPYDVELHVGGKGRRLLYKMSLENGLYRTRAELLRPAPGPRVTLTYEDGRLEGYAADRTFTLGGTKIRLGEVRTLHLSGEPRAVLADGRTVKGAVRGLDGFAISLGGSSVPVEVGRAVELTVAPPADESKVTYTVVVRRDTQELTRVENLLAFKNAPHATGPDPGDALTHLEGLWVLEKAEQNGGFYPIGSEEALLIEGMRVQWVKRDGKPAPGLPRGQLTIDSSKKPMTLDVRVNQTTWQAIYKIEGNRLTIGTNCNDEQRPAQFTTRLFAGAERCTFLRTYKRQPRGE